MSKSKEFVDGVTNGAAWYVLFDPCQLELDLFREKRIYNIAVISCCSSCALNSEELVLDVFSSSLSSEICLICSFSGTVSISCSLCWPLATPTGTHYMEACKTGTIYMVIASSLHWK